MTASSTQHITSNTLKIRTGDVFLEKVEKWNSLFPSAVVDRKTGAMDDSLKNTITYLKMKLAEAEQLDFK